MTTVFAARRAAPALEALVGSLWNVECRFGVLERAGELPRFARDGERWAEWPRGRIFGDRVEVRWERGGEEFETHVIRADGAAGPPGFEPILVLDGDAECAEMEWCYLWGGDDQAIGGRLKYADAIPGRGRAQLGIKRYTDRAGRLVFYRHVALRREPGDG